MGDNGNEKRNAKDIECISWVVVLLFNLTKDKRCLLETNYHSNFNLHPSVNFLNKQALLYCTLLINHLL